MLPMATVTIPTATSAATRPSGALVPATSSAPAARTATTPAAIRQSSPTMKSHQKRAKPFDEAHYATSRAPRGASSLTVAQASAHQAASSTSSAASPPGQLEARVVGRERAEPLDGPERAEGA